MSQEKSFNYIGGIAGNMNPVDRKSENSKLARLHSISRRRQRDRNFIKYIQVEHRQVREVM